MRYLMKQKFWSWGDDFTVKDEQGQDVYFVDGAAFSWGDKLSIQDMDGQELAFISQRLMSLLPRYEISRDGQQFAEVTKEFSWFKSKFTLDAPGPNDYSITGCFWDHEYEFERSGRTVARAPRIFLHCNSRRLRQCEKTAQKRRQPLFGAVPDVLLKTCYAHTPG